jgi:O-antigen/teichoic acid export membrane protein
VIFAIGTFSSKLLTFVMMPVYTYSLATSEYGNFNLIVQTANLLMPVITVGMTQAIIRFGVDKAYRRSDVFTTSFGCTLLAFLLLLCFSPLLGMLQFVGQYLILLLAYIFMSSFRQVCSQFVRAKGATKLFAFDGMVSTFTNCLFTVVFLLGFHWGVLGALLAVILSDFLSIVFLFWVASLHRYLHWKGLNRHTVKGMLKFALPLIPTQIFWWIVSVSDQYLVAYMISDSANGIYAAAYKVPTILMVVATIFMDAWQISAVQENNADRARFFTKVFNAYQTIMLFASALLIPFSKLLTKILVSSAYYESWRYIPFLIIATAFCNLVNFTGSVYMVEKRSVASLVTTIIGAATNCVLNVILIPLWGIQGAAVATFVSYFAVFVIRVIHTRQFIHIRFNMARFSVNVVLILAQVLIMIFETPLWGLWQILLIALFTLLNYRMLKTNLLSMVRKRSA